MKGQKQEQPLFIQCANGVYPILINPSPSFAEQLSRLKAGVYELKYDEFFDHLKRLLNEITDHNILYDSESLRYFIRTRKSMDYIVENGRLTEKWKDGEVYPVMLTPVIISLIDFLSNSEVKKIKKCPLCQKFFIAKDTKRIICYGDYCRKKYHKEDMKKRRSNDPVRYC